MALLYKKLELWLMLPIFSMGVGSTVSVLGLGTFFTLAGGGGGGGVAALGFVGFALGAAGGATSSSFTTLGGINLVISTLGGALGALFFLGAASCAETEVMAMLANSNNAGAVNFFIVYEFCFGCRRF